jgi:hypothetical protein
MMTKLLTPIWKRSLRGEKRKGTKGESSAPQEIGKENYPLGIEAKRSLP